MKNAYTIIHFFVFFLYKVRRHPIHCNQLDIIFPFAVYIAFNSLILNCQVQCNNWLKKISKEDLQPRYLWRCRSLVLAKGAKKEGVKNFKSANLGQYSRISLFVFSLALRFAEHGRRKGTAYSKFLTVIRCRRLNKLRKQGIRHLNHAIAHISGSSLGNLQG